MKTILKKIIVCICIFCFCNSLFGQLYEVSNIYNPHFKSKGEIKFSPNLFFSQTFFLSTAAAYSFKNNWATKINYKNSNIAPNVYDKIQEITVGVGYYNTITTNRAINKHENFSLKLENRFTKRKLSKITFYKAQNLKTKNLEDSFLRVPAFYYSAYLSIGNVFLKEEINNLVNYKINVFRPNLDLSIAYQTKKHFSLEFQLRTSIIFPHNLILLNSSINYYNDFVNQFNSKNYLALEGNFKVNFTTKPIDYFIKLNNTFGGRYFYKINYPRYVFNHSLNIGASFNLENIIDKKQKL